MKKTNVYFAGLKLILLSILLFTFVCIKRNNPWDPINGCPEDYRAEIRQSTIPNLQKLVSDAQNNYLMISNQLLIIDSLDAIKDSVKTLYIALLKRQDSIFRVNESIDSINRIDCKTMNPKLKADTFPSFTFITNSINIRNFRSSITDDSLNSVTRMYADNSECQPHGIYSVEFQDSIRSIFNYISTRADSLITIIRNFNAYVTDSNSQIIVQNNLNMKQYNRSVDRYNDSILLAMEYCKIDWISNPTDIKKKIESLKPGDTLSIDSGTHVVEIKFSNFGDSTRPLIIQGTPFLNTTLSYPDFSIDHSQHIIIRNITFLDSRTRGLTIENNSSGIKIEKCTFIGSTDNGLHVLNSSVSVENCIFRNNASGIFCNAPNAQIDIKNVLIVKNRKYGIECNSSLLSISKATISDNENSGIFLSNQRSPLSIVSTLLTYNSTFGLERATDADMSDISLYHSVFFNNSSGDFKGDSLRIIVDISCKRSDPQFISRDLNDYTIGNPELSILGYTP